MNLVLAIENDTTAQSDLEFLLQGNRMRIVISRLTKRLIDYIKSADPDLIIISLTLENSEELKFIVDLKKDPFTENIPVVALLSRKDENFVFNHKILGFNDYIVKPFSRQNLAEKVQTIIKEYSNYKKNKADSVDSHIEVLSHGFNTIIYLRSSLSLYVTYEIKEHLSQSMLQKLRDDSICIDIRGLFEIMKSELPILEKIISLFEGKTISIVAGKFFGLLLEHGIGREGDNIFMTPEEYDKFLIDKKV